LSIAIIADLKIMPCPKLVYRDRSGNGDNIVIISLSTDYGCLHPNGCISYLYIQQSNGSLASHS
jgi:hypothetical protein